MDKMKESTPGESGTGSGGGGEGGGGAVEGDEFHSEFYNTGRIGRRNALPDILGSHCTTTTADLPTQMGALTTSDCSNKTPNASSTSTSGSTMITNTPTTTTTGGGS